MKFFLGRDFEIWIRNSLVLGYVKFLKSDIDITILIKQNQPVINVNDIYAFHKKIKSVIKVIGELAIYHQKDLTIISQFINKFELKRDPILSLQLQTHKLEPLEFENIVYLFHFYIANYKKRDEINNRPEKLQFYLESVNSLKIKFNEIPKYILQLLNINDEYAYERIHKVLENQDFSHADFNQPIDALFFCKLIYSDKPIPPTNDYVKKLILLTVYWEIWGCYAHRHLSTEEQIKLHFQKILSRCLVYFPEYITNELEEKLTKLAMI